MNKNPVIAAADEFYEDQSRSAEQTRAGLEDAALHIQSLIDSLPESDEEFEG